MTAVEVPLTTRILAAKKALDAARRDGNADLIGAATRIFLDLLDQLPAKDTHAE